MWFFIEEKNYKIIIALLKSIYLLRYFKLFVLYFCPYIYIYLLGYKLTLVNQSNYLSWLISQYYMQIRLRHSQITKLNRVQWNVSLTWWFYQDGENLCKKKTPLGEFQVTTPEGSTNQESKSYKNKESYPNWPIPKYLLTVEHIDLYQYQLQYLIVLVIVESSLLHGS